jgi:hypothetical protein
MLCQNLNSVKDRSSPPRCVNRQSATHDDANSCGVFVKHAGEFVDPGYAEDVMIRFALADGVRAPFPQGWEEGAFGPEFYKDV